MQLNVQFCACDGQEEHDGFPLGTYVFEDGHTKLLPMLCPESDLTSYGLREIYLPLIHLGQFNPDSRVSSYWAGDILRVEENIYLCSFGDVDESDAAKFLVGTFGDALNDLLSECMYEDSLPWDQILLAKTAGYLDIFDEWDDLIPATIFKEEEWLTGTGISVFVRKEDAQVESHFQSATTELNKTLAQKWNIDLDSWFKAQNL